MGKIIIFLQKGKQFVNYIRFHLLRVSTSPEISLIFAPNIALTL